MMKMRYVGWVLVFNVSLLFAQVVPPIVPPKGSPIDTGDDLLGNLVDPSAHVIPPAQDVSSLATQIETIAVKNQGLTLKMMVAAIGAVALIENELVFYLLLNENRSTTEWLKNKMTKFKQDFDEAYFNNKPKAATPDLFYKEQIEKLRAQVAEVDKLISRVDQSFPRGFGRLEYIEFLEKESIVLDRQILAMQSFDPKNSLMKIESLAWRLTASNLRYEKLLGQKIMMSILEHRDETVREVPIPFKNRIREFELEIGRLERWAKMMQMKKWVSRGGIVGLTAAFIIFSENSSVDTAFGGISTYDLPLSHLSRDQLNEFILSLKKELDLEIPEISQFLTQAFAN